MKLRPALLTTLAISFVARIVIGLILIDAQYQLETVFYKYLFVFSGLIIIATAFKKVLTFYSVLRFTK
jgi:hypothetical protein